MRRGPLRNLMAELCVESGCPIILDAHVTSIEEDTTKEIVTVTLEDGRHFTGRCVAGCDGIHSKVRRSYLAPDVQLNNTGLLAIRGQAPDDGQLRALAGLCPTNRAGLSMFVISSPGSGVNINMWGGRVSWCFDLRAPHGSWDPGKSDTTIEEAVQIMAECTKDWHPALRRSLLESSPRTELYLEKLRDLGDYDGPHGCGRVSLIGDAGRTSMAGGGANIAFRDAKDFAAALGALGSPLPKGEAVGTALRDYESKARERLPPAKVMEARSWLPSNPVTAEKEQAYAMKMAEHVEKWEKQEAEKHRDHPADAPSSRI